MIVPTVEVALGAALGAVGVVVGVLVRRRMRELDAAAWPEWWQPFEERPPNVRILPRERRPR